MVTDRVREIKMGSKFDRFMHYVAPVVIASAAILLTAFFLNDGNSTSKDNNVYVRYIACALSVDPEVRTPDVIKGCWDHVIEESGREVHRYDEIEDNHYWLLK